MRFNSRRAAAFAVARWIATHEHIASALPEGEERAFVQDLAYTTVRRFRPLRTILGAYVKKWPKGELEALLLVGAAQILYMPDVPDFAAVSETVDAAKRLPNRNIAKVVNAVLRNVIRARDEIEKRLAAAPLEERESYPSALVKRWVARYGEAGAAALATWHNAPAETYLAHRDGRFEKLARGVRVTEVPGFAEGAFVVQDPGTAGAIELMDAKPGLRVLDYCAAPGGKTIQLAWRLLGAAEEPAAGSVLTAYEINPGRLAKLQENLKRCRLGWVRTTAVKPAEGPYDRVLVDAPCSNTGVLRRRPEARWKWSLEKTRELAGVQRAILEEAAAYVAPGGLLVYSTCSNEPEENGEQVAAFLAAHPGFREKARTESVPHQAAHDGAFACAMERVLEV